jgi:hypothetical protein
MVGRQHDPVEEVVPEHDDERDRDERRPGPPDHPGYVAWSILHQRGFIPLPWGVARTSYPVLPWMRVACRRHADPGQDRIGGPGHAPGQRDEAALVQDYALGPWYALEAGARRRRLLALGAAALASFVALRGPRSRRRRAPASRAYHGPSA